MEDLYTNPISSPSDVIIKFYEINRNGLIFSSEVT